MHCHPSSRLVSAFKSKTSNSKQILVKRVLKVISEFNINKIGTFSLPFQAYKFSSNPRKCTSKNNTTKMGLSLHSRTPEQVHYV